MDGSLRDRGTEELYFWVRKRNAIQIVAAILIDSDEAILCSDRFWWSEPPSAGVRALSRESTGCFCSCHHE